MRNCRKSNPVATNSSIQIDTNNQVEINTASDRDILMVKYQ